MSYLRGFRPFILSTTLLSKIDARKKKAFDIIKEEEEEEEENGWTRLKKMYSFGPSGLASPQFATISEAGLTGFLIGFLIGSIKDSRETFVKFIEENKTTLYQHQYEAKRKLTDTMALSLARGGWKVGWRIGLLTSSILTVVMTLHTYNGYTSIPEFSIAGAVTCGLYKFKQGPKPAVAGAAVGAALGTVAGVAITGIMKLTGTSLDIIIDYDEDRISKFNKKEYERLEKVRMKKFPDVEFKKNVSPIEENSQDQINEVEKSVVIDSSMQKPDVKDNSVQSS